MSGWSAMSVAGGAGSRFHRRGGFFCRNTHCRGFASFSTATQRDSQHSEMSNVSPPPQHAFSHAPAAMRIFRFAADSAPRVLEITHVSKFLRECAVEFGSADAALPGALRSEYAAKRYFTLRAVVERNAARCPWLAAKLLACRSGAPVPAAALAPDVTRHDVNWGAEGTRRDRELVVSIDGSSLSCGVGDRVLEWAQGAVGVTSGKHYFQVSVTSEHGELRLGWVDRALQTNVYGEDEHGPGNAESGSAASGVTFMPLLGRFDFGSPPLEESLTFPAVKAPCTVGCLLDLVAGAMTVFVDGEPLAVQCPYKFPTDREWAPTVGLHRDGDALFSNAV
jgi:hypothetical protein